MSKLLDLIQANPNLSMVLEALKTAGYDQKLNGSDKYTVFAPTNDAVTKELGSLNMTQEQYFGDTQRLERVIKFHLVPNEIVYSKDVGDDKSVKTILGGYMVDVSNENDTMLVNGINVSMRDQVADNGVLHIIDRVLVPPVPYDPTNPEK